MTKYDFYIEIRNILYKYFSSPKLSRERNALGQIIQAYIDGFDEHYLFDADEKQEK